MVVFIWYHKLYFEEILLLVLCRDFKREFKSAVGEYVDGWLSEFIELLYKKMLRYAKWHN